MKNQSPMHYPSHEAEGVASDHINLDAMPDEALACLLKFELPRLSPRFGLLPDIARFADREPETPASPPPPGIDALPDADKLHWHQTWDRILDVVNDPVQVFNRRCDKRVINVLRSWVLVVWANGRISALRWQTRLSDGVNLAPALPNELNLARLASEGGSLAVVCEGMKFECVNAHVRQGHRMTAQEPRNKNQQMFAAFREPILAKVRQLRLDSLIHARLGLDGAVVAHAQAAYGLKHRAQANEITAASYNWALSQFLELETLQRESPHLLPFYPLVADEVTLRTGYALTYQSSDG